MPVMREISPKMLPGPMSDNWILRPVLSVTEASASPDRSTPRKRPSSPNEITASFPSNVVSREPAMSSLSFASGKSLNNSTFSLRKENNASESMRHSLR